MGLLQGGRNGKAAVIGIVGLQTCRASKFCSAEGWGRDEPLQPGTDAVGPAALLKRREGLGIPPWEV